MKTLYNTEQETSQYRQERLEIFEANFTMTALERKELRKWVKDGNDVHSNPWYYSQENGYPMNFVDAMRFDKEICEEMKSERS